MESIKCINATTNAVQPTHQLDDEDRSQEGFTEAPPLPTLPSNSKGLGCTNPNNGWEKCRSQKCQETIAALRRENAKPKLDLQPHLSPRLPCSSMEPYNICEKCRTQRHSERQSQETITDLRRENSNLKLGLEAMDANFDWYKHNKATDPKHMMVMQVFHAEMRNEEVRNELQDKNDLLQKTAGVIECFEESERECEAKIKELQRQRSYSEIERRLEYDEKKLNYCQNQIAQCVSGIAKLRAKIKSCQDQLNGVNKNITN